MESLFHCKLNNVEADYMVMEVSNEEIKETLFQIDDNKAPGPNGYSAAFFKKAWNVIGNDVCLAVKEFFKTGKILREINSTLIDLVPKIQTPLKVSDFRPIACCNVIYKCISKVLTERLKRCLDKLGYDRKSGPKRVVVKVDIQKAYDTVNWYFKGGKRFRQGDLISPYLFTLVMEILTLIIKRKVDQSRDFQYHFGCKKLKVTNVCFADDLLIFCHADKNSLKVLKESIDEFGKVAGLIPNYNKSTIIFGSLDDDEKKELLEVMPFKVEKLPIRYLGVPLTSKRLRAKECKYLLDKIKSRVSSWKNKCLSYTGRLMLVASILETISVYWASVFLLHVRVIKDINKLLKNFLWQQNDGTKRRAKVAWKNVCKFKQKGGLGLKDLRWINTEKLRGRSVWEVDVDINDSWGWKNILNQKKEARKFMYSKIGDGNRTSVWRLSLAASVYLVWQERNNRIFRDEMRSPDEIYKTLEDIIRMMIMRLKVKNSVAVKKAQEVWNVKLNIIDNSDLQLQAPCILESTGCDCTH
ncbi:RNA-directed DNA polymerase, eukaryota, reverse transcriptase zinc-binding domain protein [Tanacetum coccineum]